MNGKIRLLAAFSTLLLSMCTFYDQSGTVVSPNGLSCQMQTDYGFLNQQRSAQCFYQCSDGTIRQPKLPGEFSAASPLYSASEQDLEAQFCGDSPQSTPTQQSTAESPTLAASPTSAVAVDTPATLVPSTEQSFPSATAESSTVELPPLLAGSVTMCDVAINLINFRMNEPVPDLTERSLEVQIAGQDSTCAMNPVNTSLLTCTLPGAVTFPVRVVVRLDDSVVNDFSFDGLGCAKIATPFPTTTP